MTTTKARIHEDPKARRHTTKAYHKARRHEETKIDDVLLFQATMLARLRLDASNYVGSWSDWSVRKCRQKRRSDRGVNAHEENAGVCDVR